MDDVIAYIRNLDANAIQGLVLIILNYSMIAGAVMIKAPQIINILVKRGVEGLSEAAFMLELIACASSTLYNVKMGHPFASWGEMSLISVQCFIQIILYWFFKEGISILPRVATMSAFMAAAVGIHVLTLNEFTLVVLGVFPTVMGQISRLPQIVQNAQQGHTGHLSIVTWGLSFAGCAVRCLTTVMQLNDPIQLASHAVAAVANGILVVQIVVYWNITQSVIAKKDDKKKA